MDFVHSIQQPLRKPVHTQHAQAKAAAHTQITLTPIVTWSNSRLTLATNLLQYTGRSAAICAKALHTVQDLLLKATLQLVCC